MVDTDDEWKSDYGSETLEALLPIPTLEKLRIGITALIQDSDPCSLFLFERNRRLQSVEIVHRQQLRCWRVSRRLCSCSSEIKSSVEEYYSLGRYQDEWLRYQNDDYQTQVDYRVKLNSVGDYGITAAET